MPLPWYVLWGNIWLYVFLEAVPCQSWEVENGLGNIGIGFLLFISGPSSAPFARSNLIGSRIILPDPFQGSCCSEKLQSGFALHEVSSP